MKTKRSTGLIFKEYSYFLLPQNQKNVCGYTTESKYPLGFGYAENIITSTETVMLVYT